MFQCQEFTSEGPTGKGEAPAPHGSLAQRLSPLMSGLNAVPAAKHRLFKSQERIYAPPTPGPLSLELGRFVMLLANTRMEISVPLFLPRPQRRARVSQPGSLL